MTTFLLAMLVMTASLPLIACHSKVKSTEAIPPIGYFATHDQAQAAADQANASLVQSRAAEKSAGVRDQDLPCGHYVAVSRNDSDGHPWWTTEHDMSGCPSRAVRPLPRAQKGRVQ